ncbi:MAG: transporter permease [Actinomycetia bacterium]|nr:transporter permease [Actinomycetes bacterium]
MITAPDRTAAPGRPQPRIPRAVVVVGGALLLLAVVRVLTGADDLTSAGTFSAALRLAVPIALVALGGVFCERAGVVNIGLEGMMILGTWFGAYGGVRFGPWWGVLLGILGGSLGGLLHAVATVTFNVDHVISGVAINILGAAVARYLSVLAYTGNSTIVGGGATQSPTIKGRIGHLDLPFLSGGWGTPDVLGHLARWRWFLVSDVAAVLRALTGDLSILTVVTFGLFAFSVWVLWHTALGLRLRSVGEHPAAAESLGVDVYRMKYLGVIISGALAGFGGAFLVIELTGVYHEGQTGGQGFIGLAAVIFGNWRPVGAAAGALLFGFAEAQQLRSAPAVHALLLFVALAAALGAILAIYRRQTVRALVMAVTAAGFGLWFATSDTVPTQFISFTPHITTLLVLAFAAQRLRPPAADGLPYRKGEIG